LRVIVVGISGRAGQAVARGIAPHHTIVAGISPSGRYHDLRREDPSLPDVSVLRSLFDLPEEPIDAAIDFTSAKASAENVPFLLGRKIPCIVGSTGVSDETLQRWKFIAIANETAVIWSPNFSVGATLLNAILRKASPYFDRAEIVEIHHDQKRDSPSGTALMLAEHLSPKAGGFDDPGSEIIRGVRGGIVNQVHIHSLRLPGFVGTHQIYLASNTESVIIEHRVLSREAFVAGVLLALEHLPSAQGLVRGIESFLVSPEAK
jgi:4-hydroxy-tetrahydrodipicolinate reductase